MIRSVPPACCLSLCLFLRCPFQPLRLGGYQSCNNSPIGLVQNRWTLAQSHACGLKFPHYLVDAQILKGGSHAFLSNEPSNKGDFQHEGGGGGGWGVEWGLWLSRVRQEGGHWEKSRGAELEASLRSRPKIHTQVHPGCGCEQCSSDAHSELFCGPCLTGHRIHM